MTPEASHTTSTATGPGAARLPAPAAGALFAPCGDAGLVYAHSPTDPMLHVLSPSATLVWKACVAGGPVDDLVDRVAAELGVHRSAVADDVEAALEGFGEVGIVSAPAAEPRGLPPGGVGVDPAARLGDLAEAAVEVPGGASRVDAPIEAWRRAGGDPARLQEGGSFAVAVLGDVVRVTGTDPALLVRVRGLLSSLVTERRPTRSLLVDVMDEPTVPGGGRVRVWGTHEGYRSFADRETWLAALPSELNRLGGVQRAMLVVHAACVMSPRGRVVVMPGGSGAGKSTLTGALVAAGWRYASDEAVGLRAETLAVVPYPKALVLGAEARGVLGVEATVGDNVEPGKLRSGGAAGEGPVVVSPDEIDLHRPDVVVAPRFERGARPAVAALEPLRLAQIVVDQSFNLSRQGQRGLSTVAAVAEQVAGFELRHGHAPTAAKWLTEWIDGSSFPGSDG